MIPRPDIPAERIETNQANGWWRSDRTFVDDFLDRVAEQPDKVAVIAHVAQTGDVHTVSYRQLGTMVDRTALGLMELGVEAGDIVSFQLPNWWQFPVISMACSRVGAVVNPMLPIFRAREVRYILQALGSKVFFMPQRFRRFDYVEMLAEFRDELPVLERAYTVGGDGTAGLPGFEETFLGHRWEDEHDVSRLDARRVEPNEVAEVQFTSGTTGRPKGVVHTPNTIYASYRAVYESLGLTRDTVVHTPSTMAHQTGFLNGCVMALGEGMKVVYQDVWDARVMLELIQDEGISYTAGATPYMIDLCQKVEELREQGIDHDLSSFEIFKSGGAAVPAIVPQRMRDVVGARIVMSWGMTENGCLTITRRDAPPQETAASDGFPLPWAQLKVTDFEGNPLPAGESGVLWIKGASQCVDYYPDHEVWVGSYDEDGWFNTGDLARINPDGSLRITGRVKEMIIRGGENIPVAEVESALASHADIAEAAIVAVPDDRLGERAWAVVVPATGVEHVDVDELKRHLEELGMVKQYWPEYFSVQDALPRTASGKVRKNEVRAAVLEEFESMTART